MKTTLLNGLSLAALLIGVTANASAADAPVSRPGQTFDERDGQALFQAICQGCHMDHGQGAQGAGHYPALAQNPKLAASAYAIFMVGKGQGGMPAFASRLDDEQIAAVVSYIRTHNGNAFDTPVSAAEVRATLGR
ncbi:cytochrome c [Pseudomonas sp. Teo4]|uniref:c-type cytochrome n=1 Tax=Pseudomonas sp. Teo4 TaxID=3064528 RepID=UPI002AB99860|nr:cytochrome c [Pseudomonas sp. Teo4]MDZ3992417.1 Cytochrome c6 [Pseudomonas sp. Teo4]